MFVRTYLPETSTFGPLFYVIFQDNSGGEAQFWIDATVGIWEENYYIFYPEPGASEVTVTLRLTQYEMAGLPENRIASGSRNYYIPENRLTRGSRNYYIDHIVFYNWGGMPHPLELANSDFEEGVMVPEPAALGVIMMMAGSVWVMRKRFAQDYS